MLERQINKLKLYTGDLVKLKFKINEVNKLNTSREDLLEAIELEREINFQLKMSEKFFTFVHNIELDNSISDISSETLKMKIQENITTAISQVDNFEKNMNNLKSKLVDYLSKVMK